ncbi:putative HC-toxin synthetase [Rosellinia necatrix]|uniref:Putative HC-toxin synthetase n=1 Tax=Rosellinia necatrix TaxID=77044 RepID=A0A1S8A6B7_ROSNE|nr:putative HC-toxin synthetase [Rosellinia necatrix]
MALDTSDMTVSSKLRLAWAIVISKYTNSRDVVYGVTVAGRNPSILGIDQYTGPTIAPVPFRVCLDPEATIETNLKNVQNKSLALIPFEQSGLQHISNLSDKVFVACSFQSLLVVQPKRTHHSLTSALLAERNAIAHGNNFSTYAISVICEPSTAGTTFQMIFDESVVADAQTWRIIYQLESLLVQFENHPTGLVTELNISPEDRKQLYEWNCDPAEAVEKCVHEVIHERLLEHPDSTAVCSWDGNFTYKELGLLSYRVAQKIISSGISPEAVIPIYMSRSAGPLWSFSVFLGLVSRFYY